MLLLSGMKIVKSSHLTTTSVLRVGRATFKPKDLPAQFESIDPPAVLEQVEVHDPEVYIPDPPAAWTTRGALVSATC
ncbi:hypothetical protein Hanom_Chr00s000993g01671091 [Helianthus anomalus]